METEIAEEKDYSIIIANIKWHELSPLQPYGKGKKHDLPEAVGISLPEQIALLESKASKKEFEDAVEQFSYNFLWRRYGVEASYC